MFTFKETKHENNCFKTAATAKIKKYTGALANIN
jgi:hypothetical protein